jgi:hypothetical protein
MKPIWSEQRATAIHESGHATIAFLLHRAFTTVSVVPNEDSLGRVTHPMPGGWFQPDIEITGRAKGLIEDHIMILLAGYEAEMAWCRGAVGKPADWSQMIEFQAEHDFQIACDLSDFMNGSVKQTEAHIKWLQCRTTDQVAGSLASRLIEGLANELESARTLSWRKASAFLQRALASRS